MRTVIWSKVVQSGDPGKQVTVPLDGSAKHTLTVAAYTGVDPTQGLAFAAAADTANHANRVTPGVTVPEGAWVVSYWADKSSTTTTWTPAGSVAGRQVLCGADSGRICSLLADSGACPAGRAVPRRHRHDERVVEQGDHLVDRAGARKLSIPNGSIGRTGSDGNAHEPGADGRIPSSGG